MLRQPLDTIQRIRWIGKEIKKIRSLKILEIGCGSGVFSFLLGNKGHHVVAIDKQEFTGKLQRRIEILKNSLKGKVEFIGHDIRKLDLLNLNRNFDYVICTEVIEHILDDDSLIKYITKALRKDGVLLLTTPYKYCHPLFGDKLSEVEDGGHVRWGYELPELHTLCEKHGLRVVGSGFITGYMAQKLMNMTRRFSRKIGIFSVLLIYPFRALVSFDRILMRFINHPYLSITIKAKKL